VPQYKFEDTNTEFPIPNESSLTLTAKQAHYLVNWWLSVHKSGSSDVFNGFSFLIVVIFNDWCSWCCCSLITSNAVVYCIHAHWNFCLIKRNRTSTRPLFLSIHCPEIHIIVVLAFLYYHILILILLLLALQPTVSLSLLSDFLPFRPFLTQLSLPSYSHYLYIFIDASIHLFIDLPLFLLPIGFF
jgi:hypothetical protein